MSTNFHANLNKLFPLKWVLISLPVFLILSSSNAVLGGLLPIHSALAELIPAFSTFNSKHPYNSDLAKCYALFLFALTPLQTYSLLQVPHGDIFISIQKKSPNGMLWAFLLFAFAALFLFVFMGPGTGGFFTKMLGKGTFAVAIMSPILISSLPALIRIAVWFVENQKIRRTSIS
jgi:hypothetical protein